MAAVGNPQCADEQQVGHTRNQAEVLLGWVVTLLVAGFCGIKVSGALKFALRGKEKAKATSILLQRSEGVRAYVTQFHLRTMLLHIVPCVLLAVLMSIFPERVCLTSEVRILFIGATFTACKWHTVAFAI